MNKAIALVSVCLAGACGSRALDSGRDAGSIASDGGSSSACASPIVLATDVTTNWSNVAIDGTDIVYDSQPMGQFNGFESVPVTGGAPVSFDEDNAEWFTVLDHHLFYVEQGVPVQQPGVVDFDRGTNTSRRLPGQFGDALVVANSDDIVLISGNTLLRIDRATFAVQTLPLPIAKINLAMPIDIVLAGKLAAYIASDGSIEGYDLDQAAFVSLSPPINATLIAAHGNEIVAVSGNAVLKIEHDKAPVTIAIVAENTSVLVFDDRSIAWSEWAEDPRVMHLTARDGRGTCTLSFPSDVNSVALDDTAAYVNYYIPNGSLENQSAQIARVPR